MVRIDNMNTDELYELRRKIDTELKNRARSMKEFNEKNRKVNDRLLKYGYGLIEFVNKELGFKVNVISRKRELVYYRMILAKKLRDKGVVFKDIAKIFQRDHSTFVHTINKYYFFERHQDEFFLNFEQKVDMLVKKYDFEIKYSEK